MDWKQLGTDFEYNRSVLEKAVAKLEKESQTIQSQLEQRKDAQRRIGALEGKRTDLAGEREELREAYQDASFEGDEDELECITDRREQIDRTVSELTEKMNAERIRLNSQTVDRTHAAEVAAQVHMLRPLDVTSFIGKLQTMLQEQASELNGRIRSIPLDESMYDREAYETYRAGRDSGYALQLSQHKRLADKEKAKRAKMSPISNTSDMADRMGSRRRPEDRMTVTSKGQKVKGYSERRVSTDEEGDRSQVLSGNEVRAALAAKQAKKAS